MSNFTVKKEDKYYVCTSNYSGLNIVFYPYGNGDIVSNVRLSKY